MGIRKSFAVPFCQTQAWVSLVSITKRQNIQRKTETRGGKKIHQEKSRMVMDGDP